MTWANGIGARPTAKPNLAPASLIGMVGAPPGLKSPISAPSSAPRTTLPCWACQSLIAYSETRQRQLFCPTTLFSRLGRRTRSRQEPAGGRRTSPPASRWPAVLSRRGPRRKIGSAVSELIHVPGITFVATIPAEVQPMFVFCGALVFRSGNLGGELR